VVVVVVGVVVVVQLAKLQLRSQVSGSSCRSSQANTARYDSIAGQQDFFYTQFTNTDYAKRI